MLWFQVVERLKPRGGRLAPALLLGNCCLGSVISEKPYGCILEVHVPHLRHERDLIAALHERGLWQATGRASRIAFNHRRRIADKPDADNGSEDNWLKLNLFLNLDALEDPDPAVEKLLRLAKPPKRKPSAKQLCDLACEIYNGRRLRNRFIKAATFEGMAVDNLVSDRLVDFHRAMAAGGLGMTTVAYLAVSPDGRWLVCGHQDTPLVTVFRVDPTTGRLTRTEHSAAVPAAVCVLFWP